MPWSETNAMEQRVQFIRDWLTRRHAVSELCARYGVSRKTGCKWIERYMADGRPARRTTTAGAPRAAQELLDDLVMADDPVVVDHHVANVRWNHRLLRVGASEAMDCLDGPPLGDDQELDAFGYGSAQDGCADEAGDLCNEREGLRAKVRDVVVGT